MVFCPTYPTPGRFVLRSLEVMLPFAGLPGLTARVGQEVTTWFLSHRSWFPLVVSARNFCRGLHIAVQLLDLQGHRCCRRGG